MAKCALLRDCADGELYGGKAAGLARLIGWGFDVPEGVALSWELVEKIVAGAPAPTVDVPAPWAVRSSAVGEDGERASYAGQHLTVMGTGSSGLADAIAQVHASLSSASARAYRAERRVTQPVRMAVVVQRLLLPEVSGVAFGIHPITGARGVVIEAVPGAGERLVAGEVTPDHWVLTPDGVIREHYSGDEPFGWDDDAVRRIALVVDEISRRAGRPQDVEFAVCDGRVWLLQARPVTTGPVASPHHD